MKSIIVIGGGAAGMIAAISAKTTNPSCKVILLEKNEKLGKKIYITGKGRCNVTNAAPMDVMASASFGYLALISSTFGFKSFILAEEM